MTKEKKIEAFNERAEFTEIGDGVFNSLGDYYLSVYNNSFDPSFIDSLIKELTEAKEIMEAE